jgi:hypothetical protein
MRRSFGLTLLCVLAITVAPLAVHFARPVDVARAEPTAPAAVPHDEVVTLSPGGQIVVRDVFPQTGMVAANWTSPDTGWQYVAAGDFRGDGYEQIVAISGARLKVFDPFAVAAGKTPVTFERALAGSSFFERIATGDFNRDGKDEIVATAWSYSPYGETLWVYDVLTDSVVRSILSDRPVAWHAITTGDFNADGASDVALVRNETGLPPFFRVYSGLDWTIICEGTASTFPYITMEAGRLASPNPVDQLALLRTGMGASVDSLLMFNVSSVTGFSDLFPQLNGTFRYEPNFTSLALGNFTAGGQQVIFMLRNSGDPNKTGLLMVNPAGLSIPPFEYVLADYSSWRQVRTGDLTGDGLSEVVILSAYRLGIYTQIPTGYSYSEVAGAFAVPPSGTDWPVMVMANLDGPGISLDPTLSVTPASLAFNQQYGDTSATQTLSIANSSTSSSFPWQAQVIEGSDWLQIGATQGVTPGQLNVTVRTTVAPNTYSGKIRISSTDTSVKNNPVDVPVSYTLTGTGLVVTPEMLVFNVPWGDPGPQQPVTINTSGGGAISWTAEVIAGSPWLKLGALSGTTPGTLFVSVNSTAAGVGTKTGTIKISAPDATVDPKIRYVTVDLTVTDPGFVVYPSRLDVRQQAGAPPITQDVQIVNPAAPVNWVATALPLTAATDLERKLASGEAKIVEGALVVDGVAVPPPAWLVFTPDQGLTPGVMQVSVKPGTVAGRYRAVIVVAATDPAVTAPVGTVLFDAVLANHFVFLPLVMK